MSFDALKFLRDYRIPHATTGSKHTRKGWVNVHCPFCAGSRDYHLGLELEGKQRIKCWRCGGKSLFRVVKTLARCREEDVGQVIHEYQGRSSPRPGGINRPDIRKECTLPLGTSAMSDRHRGYLEKRKFNPELLERTYLLQGTGPLSDPPGYSHRIILPIYFERKLVSYQGRDITGRCEDSDKYRACSMDREAIHHKHVLYGWDLFEGKVGAVVEGAADQWRMGPGSLATFGTGFTQEQLVLLARRFKRLFLLFDPEPIAQQVAEKLSWALGHIGCEAPIVDLSDEGVDPGALQQVEADAIMRDLHLPGWN